ncbi:EF-hand domain-containing protein [Pseudomonas sp. 21LCFQ02]|uniref:EF-hand domain-containing protein n=1 Tax=Pseudomonas sp. 21LCFQ02 TaxID=2957505 RepID=UPI00209ACC47|nr:EF-hand domain-containing protein [Pseudomonas sp. 21LCFQ02]MCO8167955.1 EF-hand domain-containing protein [Pseudomonas sp. 21LCFQ02]
MINAISNNYSSYTSTSNVASNPSKRFQEMLLTKLDADEDGSISKDELSSALSNDSKDGISVSLSQAFSSLDSDADDSLNAEELAAFTPPPPPGREGFDVASLATDLLGTLDSDADGAVSNDELTTALSNAGSSADSSKVFSALDSNEDGTVSLEELTAALQPQQPPAGPPPAQNQAADADSSNTRQLDTQALNRMIAALGERYDTEGSKPVGRYLDTAA